MLVQVQRHFSTGGRPFLSSSRIVSLLLAMILTLISGTSQNAVAQDYRRRSYERRDSDSSTYRSGRSSETERISNLGGDSSRQSFMYLFNPNPSTIDVNYTYAPSREPDGTRGSDFDNQMFRADVNFPMQFNKDFSLYFGGTYGVREFQFDSINPASVLRDDQLYLHQVELRPGVSYFLNEDLLLAGQVRLGLFGNLGDEMSEDNAQVLGNGMLIYRWHPKLQLIGGVLVSEDYDSQNVLPVLGFRYLSDSKRWHWLVTLPTQAQVQYNFTKTARAYGGLTISGQQYHYEGDRGNDFDIQVRDTKLGGGLLFNIGEHLILGAEGGILVGKEALAFKIRDNEFSGDLNDSPYVQGRLGLRF